MTRVQNALLAEFIMQNVFCARKSFSCTVFLVYSSVGVPNRHFRTLSTVYGKYISLRTGPVNHTEDEAALIDSIESSLCLQFIIEV